MSKKTHGALGLRESSRQAFLNERLNTCVWIGTWVFDWAWFLLVIRFLDWWFTSQELVDPWGLPAITGLIAVLIVLMILRDDLMMVVLGDMVSEFKTEKRTFQQLLKGPVALTCKLAIPVWLMGLSSPLALTRGMLDWHFDVATLEGAMRAWSEWILFYLWKDVVAFHFIHRAMHENWVPGLYAHHKEHHVGKRDLNIFISTQIDFMDIFIESTGIVFENIPVMWALGWPIKMHMASFVLTSVADLEVHSVNPFTVCWFNPILDWILLGNINHNLHHAKGKGHYSMLPLHHVVPSWRQEDVETYNRLMNTNWELTRCATQKL